MRKFNIPDSDTSDITFDDTLCSTCVHSTVCHFVFTLSELADAGCMAIAIKCAHYIQVPNGDEELEDGEE